MNKFICLFLTTAFSFFIGCRPNESKRDCSRADNNIMIESFQGLKFGEFIAPDNLILTNNVGYGPNYIYLAKLPQPLLGKDLAMVFHGYDKPFKTNEGLYLVQMDFEDPNYLDPDPNQRIATQLKKKIQTDYPFLKATEDGYGHTYYRNQTYCNIAIAEVVALGTNHIRVSAYYRK